MRRLRATAIAVLIALGAVSGAGALSSPDALSGAGAAVGDVSSVVSPADSGSGLSDIGQSAIADLRVCLSSESTLNVYYLVDSSLSLQRADDGGPGSDPGLLRASILGSSLTQLGGIAGDIDINWAAGFFSDGYTPAVGWRPWTGSSPAQLAQVITDEQPSGYTNWPAGLAGVQNALATQQGAAPGCQLLIWLTDGQLDIQAPDGQQQEDVDALARMCSPAGVFTSFRQAGVVVIGALLAVDSASRAAAPDMQALVEGGAPGADAVCGEQPPPASHVHGAFVAAAAPDALAQVFLQLTAQVEGGYPQPFEADGAFWIDEGISRFRIIVGGDWTLTPPAEFSPDAATAGSAQDWATVTRADGATVIDVRTTAAASGRWHLEAGDAQSLFLFSDLRIVFEERNSIELAADGHASAALEATVVDADGDAVDLDVYGRSDFTAWYLDAAGERIELDGAHIDAPSGRIRVPLPAELNLAQLAVTASLEPLVTKDHRLPLAPVRGERTVTTVLPAQFPHVRTLPVELSDLEGARDEATGDIVLVGPAKGGDGIVCLPEQPVVISDTGSRDGWRWSVAEDLDDRGCIIVPAGGEVRVGLSAANSTAADSAVKATFPVEFHSASGEVLTQQVPLEFRSTHPVNTTAVLLSTLALLLSGALVPLLILWAVNAATARIDVPASTERAAFPVLITSAGNRVTAPSGGSALSDAFQFRSPSSGARSIPDADLGTMRARVPWFPLRAPWYDVVALADRTAVTARAGRSASALRDRKGRLRFATLPLDRFSAVIVSDAELGRTARGDDVAGTVVIYHRASAGDQGGHAERIREIEVDSSLADAVARARAALLPADSPGEQVTGVTAVPALNSASGGAADPPGRPGPPPLPGRAPGGAPPPQP